jgi:hypothetical protein
MPCGKGRTPQFVMERAMVFKYCEDGYRTIYIVGFSGEKVALKSHPIKNRPCSECDSWIEEED